MTVADHPRRFRPKQRALAFPQLPKIDQDLKALPSDVKGQQLEIRGMKETQRMDLGQAFSYWSERRPDWCPGAKRRRVVPRRHCVYN